MKNKGVNPSAYLLWIFAVEVMILFFASVGALPGDTNLIYGLLMVGTAPGYFVGGILLARQGDEYMANLWLLFGVLFGWVFGFCEVGYFFGDLYGWGLNASMPGIPVFLSGLIVLPTMLPCRTLLSKAEFLV